MKVVIVGGGIMGVSTAYYLNKLNLEKYEDEKEDLELIIIDSLGIAKCASGNAGGFLARNWCKGLLNGIGQLSFDMFPGLADEFGKDKIQYRRIGSMNAHVERMVDLKIKKTKNSHRDPFNNVFDKRKITPSKIVSTSETTAQVTPPLLCHEMFKASKAKFIRGELVGVRYNHLQSQQIIGVMVKIKKGSNYLIEEIQADEFCFCLGVWTHFLRDMNLKVPRSLGRPLHAVIIKVPKNMTTKFNNLNHAILTDFNHTEVIPRPNGHVYINGSEPKYEKVTKKPGEYLADEDKCKRIIGFWNYLTAKPKDRAQSKLLPCIDYTESEPAIIRQENEEEVKSTKNATKIVKACSCHLPAIDHKYNGQELPVMSKIPKTFNGYLCTGHKSWGILLGPICGKIMSKMILDKHFSAVVDTTPFRLDPKLMRSNSSRKSRYSRTKRKSMRGIIKTD